MKQKIIIRALTIILIYIILIVGKFYFVDKHGLGVFIKWGNYGFSSLTYELDLINLLIDFLPFLIVILFLLQYTNFQPNKVLRILIYSFVILALLYVIFNLIAYKIYFGTIYNLGD